MDFFYFAVVVLIILAVADLVVGVSNDAVNFLNSSIGSRVAPRFVIMTIASLGIIVGVTFSSGMMEVARKGIFHPNFFTMPELMVIFLAVMITDILLLDHFNTYGMPTSTTVSIIFELLGAAVAVSFLKLTQAGQDISGLGQYINTGKVLAIISGILLSVAVAFICGSVIQLFSRLLFTFKYQKRMKYFGSVWGGLALTMILYFVLIKGAKGSSIINPETAAWIQTHTATIMLSCLIATTAILQIIISFTRIDILKIIVLSGTFALAMAFAANDLVNFIGVPLAGFYSYRIASESADPLNASMEALLAPINTNTLILLAAGIVMVATLWISRKSRTVTETEVSLSRQDEGFERFESTGISRITVRFFSGLIDIVKLTIPPSFRKKISARLETIEADTVEKNPVAPPFDLIRASVNLMVASALISLGTAYKLPLSTTYVTFMVAMGSSLSDRAWGLDSAVFRVTGVYTVIAGWFFTAFAAFTVSMVFAAIMFYSLIPGFIIILLLSLFIIWKNHQKHSERVKEKEGVDVFNLKKITDSNYAIGCTFDHNGIFLGQIGASVTECIDSLSRQDLAKLRSLTRDKKKFQLWANVITANVFKTLRFLNKEETLKSLNYAQIITMLQDIAEAHRDIVMRSYTHVRNHHKPLLDEQIAELNQLKDILSNLLESVSEMLIKKHYTDENAYSDIQRKLKALFKEFDKNQIKRIQNNESKTRLSMLFYGIMGNMQKISDHTLNLIRIYNITFTR